MISLKSCIELANALDNCNEKVIDRILTMFDLDHLVHPTLGRFTLDKKVNVLLSQLKYPPRNGPFTDSFRMDLLQYFVEFYYRNEEEKKRSAFITYNPIGHIKYEDRFSHAYRFLANSLKRDGYEIIGTTIQKMLPKEMIDTNSDTELSQLLDKYNFSTSKLHFEQATKNHTQGNWAGANSQFRTFIESLLIDIANRLLPLNNCNSASVAIKLLGNTVNPPFLEKDLNEVGHQNCPTPFVEGLWKRLHPQGSHPGPSNEQDCTFRYHITLVFGHYLLKKLDKLNNQHTI